MPCYLFTYHAHGSWMPDHRRGYVHRGKGLLPPDKNMAARYRANSKQDAVFFDSAIQRHLIEETLVAGTHQHFRTHFLATEPIHLHALVSWAIEREWQIARAKLRESLTRRLNQEVQRRERFSKSPSRKQVKDQRHFDYLVTSYLPKHSGLKWCERRGIFQ